MGISGGKGSENPNRLCKNDKSRPVMASPANSMPNIVRIQVNPKSSPEWSILELQGKLEPREPRQFRFPGTTLGELRFVNDTPLLTVGNVELSGKLVDLPNPFWVMQRFEMENAAKGGPEAEHSLAPIAEGCAPGDLLWRVVGQVRRKIIFRNRPRPVVYRTPQQEETTAITALTRACRTYTRLAAGVGGGSSLKETSLAVGGAATADAHPSSLATMATTTADGQLSAERMAERLAGVAADVLSAAKHLGELARARLVTERQRWDPKREDASLAADSIDQELSSAPTGFDEPPGLAGDQNWRAVVAEIKSLAAAEPAADAGAAGNASGNNTASAPSQSDLVARVRLAYTRDRRQTQDSLRTNCAKLESLASEIDSTLDSMVTRARSLPHECNPEALRSGKLVQEALDSYTQLLKKIKAAERLVDRDSLAEEVPSAAANTALQRARDTVLGPLARAQKKLARPAPSSPGKRGKSTKASSAAKSTISPKKRGRPPKSTTESNEKVTAKSATSSPTKRGRGRPPKSTPAGGDPATAAGGSLPPTEQKPEEKENEKKRKEEEEKGKEENEIDNGSGAKKNESETAAKATDSPSKKRGRGRPPKEQTKEKQIEKEEKQQQEEISSSSSPAKKKKRGRPKKTQ